MHFPGALAVTLDMCIPLCPTSTSRFISLVLNLAGLTDNYRWIEGLEPFPKTGGETPGLIDMEHPLTMSYGPVSGWILLLLLGGVSGGFFLYQVVKASRLVFERFSRQPV